jgi:hypothetical protein
MTKTMTGIRLEDEMLGRIDAFAARVRKETPGLDVNRAMAIRMLLALGLEAAEKKKR